MKYTETPSILIVDDEKTYRDFLKDSLMGMGYNIITASNGIECLRELKRQKIDILLTDMVLPDFSGLRILELAKQLSPPTDVIMITGYATMDTAIKALKSGASDYITKPVNIEELKIIIKKYIDKRNVINENVKLLNKFKLIEELKNLSIYNNIEGFLTYLNKIINEHLKIKKSFGYIIEKNKVYIIATSGLSKKVAADLCRKMGVQKIKNIPPGKSAFTRIKKYNASISCLGGKNKKGYLVLLKKGDEIKEKDKELLNEITGYSSVYFRAIVDIDEAKYLSYIDDLTELYNPRYLKIIVNKEIKKAEANKTKFSILFLDLDHFKEVNDTYGHLIGGQILCEVAKVLKNSVRNADVVVRYGGDEYVIVLFNTDKNKAKMIAERIRRNIDNHTFLGREGYRIRLTVCIGIASFPEHARTYKKLIDYSDKAMYIGKEGARNTIHTADDLKKI